MADLFFLSQYGGGCKQRKVSFLEAERNPKRAM